MLPREDRLRAPPYHITKYYFVDEKKKLITFTILPFQWNKAETPENSQRKLFLHGNKENGPQKVCKEVIAWKASLQDDHPKFFVLSRGNKWIKLQNPLKSYRGHIRTLLITAWWLHFIKRAPEASDKSIWDHLSRVFSTYEVPPSVIDLKNQLPLIKLFADKDKILSTSQLLSMFLNDSMGKRSGSYEPFQTDQVMKKPFISPNAEVEERRKNCVGDDIEEDSGLFDSVCAICDNGGEILCCEGRCMRSFHPTKDAGVDSSCKSLGYSRAEVEAMHNFICKNCQYKQHQCFACGKLGCSDKEVGAKVLPCVSATCGYFYHPKCVAQLLFPESTAEATEFQKKIVAGESFTCPVHKCIICRGGENKMIKDLQFAVCRRCPKAYHRKCLPRDIVFEVVKDGVAARAWDNLLPNRILIYCNNHMIDENLATPIRNHIIFPDVPEKKEITSVCTTKVKLLLKKRQITEPSSRENIPFGLQRMPEKPGLKVASVRQSSMSAKEDAPPPIKKSKVLIKGAALNSHTDNQRSGIVNKVLQEEDPKAPVATGLRITLKKFNSSFPVIDCETEKRMLNFMKKASSSSTLEDIMKKRAVPSTHAYSARHVEKSITQGKVEGSVEAIQTALSKIESGVCVEDAKAVCEPEVLQQMHKWRQKLKVYLAPFLLGARYSSFGRHFTKVEKLIEIVEKLQWYVQNGDTIVDFCCGANDFSRLMKEKLEKVGKNAFFKNYDLMQPKHDFNFEKRDWMTVQPSELPDGSKLIMGLNPPFGVKASLANMFIDKALTFRPKLLILIVPKETERLDVKKEAYNLIWEDSQKLSGKSFYLPGSVDVEDQQLEQWNLKPPPLYLWSRPDWTATHKQITSRHRLMPADSLVPDGDAATQVNRNTGCRSHFLEFKAHKRKKRKKHRVQQVSDVRNDGIQCEGQLSAEAFNTSFEQENNSTSFCQPAFEYGSSISSSNPFKRSSEEHLRMQVKLYGMQSEYSLVESSTGLGKGKSSNSLNYGSASLNLGPPSAMAIPLPFPDDANYAKMPSFEPDVQLPNSDSCSNSPGDEDLTFHSMCLSPPQFPQL